MHDSGRYKVIGRTRFTLIMAILMCVVALGVWLGLESLAEYTKQLQGLAVAEPAEAAAILTQLLRTLAIVNGIVLSLLALWIIRHGRRGWRTASMPPEGSWIVEGQRTWSGAPAVRIARFTVTMGTLLGVLAVAGSVILWRLGDTL